MGHNKSSDKMTSNVGQDDKASKPSKSNEASTFSQNPSKKK
jgi:hypothetical protein